MMQRAQLQGRVLLVEDDENNQRLLSLFLTKMGLQVSHAENEAIAVKRAAEEQFDLILMDMQMPVLPSVETVQQLRGNGQREPIIALSANTGSEDRRLCIEAGCNDFLAMPLTRDSLYRVLAQYLALREPAQTGIEPLYSELAAQGPEFVDIVNQFVAKLPEQIDAISHAYHANDWDSLHRLVHNLKGTGGGFGFLPLTEQAVEIEKLLTARDYAGIEAVIGVLRCLLQRIQAGLPQQVSLAHGRVGN
jgi:CheY-like chemotaxis protein